MTRRDHAEDQRRLEKGVGKRCCHDTVKLSDRVTRWLLTLGPRNFTKKEPTPTKEHAERKESLDDGDKR